MKIDLTVFMEKNGKFVDGIAFMQCPNCNEQICLTTDKLKYCRKCGKNKGVQKIVYKLHANQKSDGGFDRVDAFEVDTYRKEYLLTLNKKDPKGE